MKRSRKIAEENKDKIHSMYYEKHMSHAAIGETLGVGRTCLRELFRREGWEPRPVGTHMRWHGFTAPPKRTNAAERLAEHKEFIAQKLMQGWPQRKIAEAIGASKWEIDQAKKTWSLPSRPTPIWLRKGGYQRVYLRLNISYEVRYTDRYGRRMVIDGGYTTGDGLRSIRETAQDVAKWDWVNHVEIWSTRPIRKRVEVVT